MKPMEFLAAVVVTVFLFLMLVAAWPSSPEVEEIATPEPILELNAPANMPTVVVEVE